ncbi:MAG: hypothetical protein NZ740_02025 [Kiritimatiellae bacterium]|nr:hypothetical protein [Kiritimatiellia bacterium]MDW8457868.1 hypothetical protein [Verrucomicrobiota bacterium]
MSSRVQTYTGTLGFPSAIGKECAPSPVEPDYTLAFDAVFQQAAERKDVRLLLLVLEGAGGLLEFNLEDGITPNAKG